MPSELYTLPIPARPPHPTPLRNRLLLFPIVLAGVLVILGVQACFIPVAIASRGWSILRRLLRMREEGTWLGDVYEWGVKRTKQMFGMLLILVTVLFAPTSITLTSDASLPLKNILVRPSPGNKHGLTYLKLPTDLVIMSNHQAYLDWIFIWILGHLSVTPDAGTAGDEYHHGSRSLIILLKRSLKWVPLVGWGMQFYRFIFLARSWALDRTNLSLALRDLAARARRGAGLWVLIFPEGTITSDDERAKSVRYARKEGVPDFVNLLHPRSTGLLFILRTLVPQIRTLRLLDITIGYPGVTRGGYAQEWYGLTSVFMKGIAPPTIHIHLRMIDLAREVVPGVTDETGRHDARKDDAISDTTPLLDQQHQGERITAGPPHPSGVPGVASEEQARAFNVWLRQRWSDKEALLDRFTATGGFAMPPRGEDGEVVEDEVEKRELAKGSPVVIPIGLW
ncbi:hypothetical protein NCC49_005590 [Naganishia albida]|nr:hypothetical protein NCC49_005590 [Naganishia albida]